MRLFEQNDGKINFYANPPSSYKREFLSFQLGQLTLSTHEIYSNFVYVRQKYLPLHSPVATYHNLVLALLSEGWVAHCTTQPSPTTSVNLETWNNTTGPSAEDIMTRLRPFPGFRFKIIIDCQDMGITVLNRNTKEEEHFQGTDLSSLINQATNWASRK